MRTRKDFEIVAKGEEADVLALQIKITEIIDEYQEEVVSYNVQGH